MDEGVLFEITKENLETGMRGYPVGYCNTSYVDPLKGLFYVGKPIAELAQKSEVEVIFLLQNRREGTPAEIAQFKKELAQRSHVSKATLEQIKRLPREGHPMKLLAASLLVAGMLECKGDYREDELNLIARIPIIVATLINHHAGWGDGAASNPELGYMDNFVAMLNIPGKKETNKDLIFAMKLFNILHYDHGGGNLSTFVGKSVASGLEDMYGSASAAMCALAGPRHGRANQDCLEFVESILREVGEDASREQIETLLRDKLARNELVFGFGHAVLRIEDPRATIFYDFVQKKYPTHPLVKIAMKLRECGTKVLAENPKISDPFPNVDAISGVSLVAAGFPYPEYFTVLFGQSRVVGIARQIVYERLEARGGKGTPLVRPKYFYIDRDDVSG